MSESSLCLNDLPYRVRIMKTASLDCNKANSTIILNNGNKQLNNIHQMKPMIAKSLSSKVSNNACNTPSYADLQPLQWLQQDAILSITPLDNEEEFVPGKEDITSITTSPVKVDVVCDSRVDDTSTQSSTIADFYRYQAMRAAMANGNHGGGSGAHRQTGGLQSCGGRYSNIRSNVGTVGSQHGSCQSVNEFQKPPFSYTHIIFMAIETSPNKAMTVNDIYVWCETHFPYYTQAGVGWKNSLRHNLSINKSFKKISRDGRGGPGRGAYWVVEPRERNNLIDAIRRSPCSLGSFPFLGNTYSWGTTGGNGGCFPTNIFQPSNSITNNSSAYSHARNFTTTNNNSNKIVPPNHTTARGPLLRIGGHLTDASQLIRSTPVIQRLADTTNKNIIDFCNASQIVSNGLTLATVPLIQFDQLKLDHYPHYNNHCQDIDNNSNSSMFGYSMTTLDESEYKGKVVTSDGYNNDIDPEIEHSYFEMIRSLIDSEAEKSESGRTESIKEHCPEHGYNTKQQRNPSFRKSNNCHDSGVIEDILPPEDFTDSDETSAVSINEFSEMSDTDFNLKITVGRRSQRKDTRTHILSKLKTSNNRRFSNSRNRINNIIRAPHTDHIYAILQEYLPPANSCDAYTTSTHNIDDMEHLSVYNNNKVQSVGLNGITLSKRSKHKLQSKRIPKKYISESDEDSPTYDEYLKYLNCNASDSKPPRRKSLKSSTSPKRILRDMGEVHDKKQSCNRHLYDTKEVYDDSSCDEYDKEEQENRCFYDCDNSKTNNGFLNSSIKIEETEKTQSPLKADSISCTNHKLVSAVKSKRFNKENQQFVKRKVGRPKKSDLNLGLNQKVSVAKCKLSSSSKVRKKAKSELNFLKESNINHKTLTSEISNNDEQVAIKVLANLQRKNQMERVTNMFNFTSYLNECDSPPDSRAET